MVALASLCAGAASAQTLPTFDTVDSYFAPQWPMALAVTPDGFDLVGATDLVADGYPEIAVAGQTSGEVRFYRNTSSLNANSPGKEITLQPLLFPDVQIFTLDVLTTTEAGSAVIQDIALANFTNDDIDPDLLVAISYLDGDGSLRGKLAHFRAQRLGGILSYTFFSVVGFDYPVTGLTIDDFSKDGHPDVLVAFEESPGNGSPNLIAAVRSDPAPGSGIYGILNHIGDYTLPAPTGYATANIISGQFSLISSGGLGGGGGTGNTLDFISFGGDSNSSSADDGVILGRGTGVGPFTFALTTADADCGTNTYGLANGYVKGQTAALVAFDPFTNQNQTIAANTDTNKVSLIHNKPRTGALFHLCNGNSTTDIYEMTPGAGLPSLNQISSYLASGNLDTGPDGDLVFINPQGEYMAFLLGNGAPDANNRIMDFDRTNNDYYVFNYAPDGGTDFDRVLCSDLNMDGFDDVVITRFTTWSDDSWRMVVLTNTTNLP